MNKLVGKTESVRSRVYLAEFVCPYIYTRYGIEVIHTGEYSEPDR